MNALYGVRGLLQANSDTALWEDEGGIFIHARAVKSQALKQRHRMTQQPGPAEPSGTFRRDGLRYCVTQRSAQRILRNQRVSLYLHFPPLPLLSLCCLRPPTPPHPHPPRPLLSVSSCKNNFTLFIYFAFFLFLGNAGRRADASPSSQTETNSPPHIPEPYGLIGSPPCTVRLLDFLHEQYVCLCVCAVRPRQNGRASVCDFVIRSVMEGGKQWTRHPAVTGKIFFGSPDP